MSFRYKYIVKHIEVLSKDEQKELFKIIHENDTNYTRNNNGVFVNLSWVSDEIIEKVYTYIKYCIHSHNTIENAEKIQEEMKKTHMTKTETETETETNNNKTSEITGPSKNTELEQTNITYVPQTKQKSVSSTMKFYITRKRLLKTAVHMNKLSNDVLEYDIKK